MIVVIQCAKSKKNACFSLKNGRKVKFIANVNELHQSDKDEYAYFHPDAPLSVDYDAENFQAPKDVYSWRDYLEAYNKHWQLYSRNPFGLYSAIDLYSRKEYRKLVNRPKIKQVYILSAGWGMMRENYLLPNYDITFSSASKPYQKRHQDSKPFKDFTHITDDYRNDQFDKHSPIIFIGVKSYLPLFDKLTKCLPNKKIMSDLILNENKRELYSNNYEFTKMSWKTHTYTNWQYSCVDFLLYDYKKCIGAPNVTDKCTVKNRNIKHVNLN